METLIALMSKILKCPPDAWTQPLSITLLHSQLASENNRNQAKINHFITNLQNQS